MSHARIRYEQPTKLTDLQIQITALVAGGASNRVAARELHLSEHTVSSYLSQAMCLLGAANRVELVARCFHIGLLSSADWPPAVAESVRNIELGSHEEGEGGASACVPLDEDCALRN